MKRALLVTIALLSMLRVAAEAAPALTELRFRDLYDREVTLKGDEATPAWVLFFFSNTCPVARRYMPRIAQLENEYGARGVRFIGINASPADTLQDIADFAWDFDVPYPILKDNSFSPVKTLGITRTPEVAVLDKDLVAVYHGRIDDQYRLGGIRPSATRHDLKETLDAVLGGRKAPVSHVPAEGCAITFPDAVISSTAREEGHKEPDTAFTYEFRLEGAGEAGDIPGTREWELVPPIADEVWINAVQVKGPSHGASIFYLDPEVPGKRHYVAGALSSTQPVQWNSDEGIPVPVGRKLRLSIPDRSGSDLSVRLTLLESPPAREISCSRKTVPIRIKHPEAFQLIQAFPAGATMRWVAVEFTGYGASLTIEQINPDQTASSLLSFPILDPARPATFRLTDASPQTEAFESVRATLLFPGYLRSPMPDTPISDPKGDARELSLSMFLYWSLPG
jgi:thiol-disulfide isomerase/thioredoxin